MTAMNKLSAFCCILTAVFLSTLGCENSARVISQQKQYILKAVRKGDKPIKKGTKVLKVSRFSVSSPFESYELVIRTDELQYKTDFYNRFLSPLGSIITDETRKWLSDSDVFGSVLDTTSSANHHFTLEGNVQAIYGDYRDDSNIRAVLEIRFILINFAGTKDNIVFDRQYHSEHPLTKNNAEELVMGLCYCLSQILVDLENDMSNLPQVTVVEE